MFSFCKVPLLLRPSKSRPHGLHTTRVVPGPMSPRHRPISAGRRSCPTTVWRWIPACATGPSSSGPPRGRPKEQASVRLRPKSASATATIPPCMSRGLRMCTIYPSRTSLKPRRVTNTLSSTVTARG